MGRPLVILFVAVAMLLGGYLLFRGDGGSSPGPDPAAPTASAPPTSAPPTPTPGPAPAVAPGPAPLQRSVPRPPDTGALPPLADTTTAWLLVVDRKGGQPIPGATVLRYLGGASLNFTDARGLAGVPLKDREQLAVCADGYLFRLAPTVPGSTEDRPQRVEMVGDDFTLRARFRFVEGNGNVVPLVKARVRPQQQSAAAVTPPVPAGVKDGGPEVERAYREHTMLASMLGGSGLRMQLGQLNQQVVHELRGEDEMRFAAAGLYLIEAATTDGKVGRAAFTVAAGAAAPLVVPMVVGQSLAGVVQDARSGVPVVGAHVCLQDGDPLGLAAVTDAAGRFELSPVNEGSWSLEVRHDEHDPVAAGPFTAGNKSIRVPMQPAGGALLRGVVRSRPGNKPVAGAGVSVLDRQGSARTTTTHDDGSFTLAVPPGDAMRLTISAAGFLTYGEILAPREGLTFDLWPSDPAVRVQLGLTAMFAGTVTDARGVHQVGMPVRLQMPAAGAPPGLPDRRIVDGGLPLLPQLVSTGTDGTFAIETVQTGKGVLYPVDGVSRPEDGVPVEAVPGRTQQVRLVSRKNP